RVLPLHLPELCTRGNDVELLIDHFLRLKAEREGVARRGFTSEAMRALVDYPWPGNFRDVLQAYMNETVPLAEIEKRYILSVLQQFGGNQVRAAAALGIDRSKLYRRLKQYGV